MLQVSSARGSTAAPKHQRATTVSCCECGVLSPDIPLIHPTFLVLLDHWWCMSSSPSKGKPSACRMLLTVQTNTLVPVATRSWCVVLLQVFCSQGLPDSFYIWFQIINFLFLPHRGSVAKVPFVLSVNFFTSSVNFAMFRTPNQNTTLDKARANSETGLFYFKHTWCHKSSPWQW